MKDSYDIAVIGLTTVGKSSWIASLFREDIALKLANISKTNTEGQTKVAVRYVLQDNKKNDLCISKIGWNYELLSEYLRKKESLGAMVKLEEFFKFPTMRDKEAEERNEGIGSGIKAYLEGEEFNTYLAQIDPIEVLSVIINDSLIGESSMVSYVELSGPANEGIWEMIQKHRLKEVKVRDTRGFMDDTQRQMEILKDEAERQEGQKGQGDKKTDTEKQSLQRLLDVRGISGIDACVFMSREDISWCNGETGRTLYGPTIEIMLKKHPLFLVIRTDRLVEVYEKEPETRYLDAVAQVKNIKAFKGFKDLRKFLERYGLQEKTGDYHTDIARKHYKELLIPYIDTPEQGVELLQEEMEYFQNQEAMYRKSAFGVFEEVLRGVQDYYARIEDTERFLESIPETLEEICDGLYNEEFDSNICWSPTLSGKCFNDNLTRWFSVDVLCNKIVTIREYYGEMVGPRGGLTTLGGSRYIPIVFLETAYEVQKNIYKKAVERLEPVITDYVKKGHTNKDDITQAVNDMKQKLDITFQKVMDSNFERLYCTDRMIPREYLEEAFYITKEDLICHGGQIDGCREILESMMDRIPRDSGAVFDLKADSYCMAVVKVLIKNMICAFHKDKVK